MTTQEIFPAIDVIEQTIKLAELDTTAEFKVHIENKCPGDVKKRAMQVFNKLYLKNTKKRNAVLIYVAVDSGKFTICFDTGIQEAIGNENYEEKANHILMNSLREEKPVVGIIDVIDYLGKALGKYFPYSVCHPNEIEDEVSISES